uniref:Trichome birefringence-like N-terminal domain-containing protein n=1 Tax=Kalanchoe fedtschenkoi TaxID=63787 RepID=A0A7N0UHE5_KALFE
MAPKRINVSKLLQRLTRPRYLAIVLLLFFFISLYLICSSVLINQSPFLVVTSLAVQASSFIFSFTPIASFKSFLVNETSGANATLSAFIVPERSLRMADHYGADWTEKLSSCDLFDGSWVADDDSPVYKPGSCPYVDKAFDCFKNGRPDSGFLKHRWKPAKCEIPRFNGTEMLKLLTGKRMVFVGDSLNRNMWESLVCAIRESMHDKTKMVEVSGSREFKTQSFYSFKFEGCNCSIDFIRSPFLIKELRTGSRFEGVRLDKMHDKADEYRDADIVVFNSGHWWTHSKTKKGENFFREGDRIYSSLPVAEAYTRAMRTWGKWVDENMHPHRTRVFFRGYSASHFKGGQWNSGGNCHGETKPISNESHLAPYPSMMMSIAESVFAEMKTPVFYLNITKMTAYRKDGHPSIFRPPGKAGMPQDCSHWCLPGVPDSWNELLYAALVASQ